MGTHRDILENKRIENPKGGLQHFPTAVQKGVFKLILQANRISKDWGALEKGAERVDYMSATDISTACLYGALRRMGQGWDPTNEEISEVEVEEDGGEEQRGSVSVFTGLASSKGWNVIKTDWVQALLKRACNTHMEVKNILLNEAIANQPEA
jgi:hypothetical protein